MKDGTHTVEEALAVVAAERFYGNFAKEQGLRECTQALADEVKRLREAIAGAKWPSDCLGAYCPWCENNPEEGHGEWRGKPCPAKEGSE